MSDVLKRILCLALALVVVFSFAGCRKSPVLEQTIYTQDAEVDPENQQTDNDEEHTDENTTLPPRTTQQTASRQNSQTKVSAKPKSNPNNNNNTNSNSNTNTNSRTGNQSNSASGGGGGTPNSTSNTNKGQGEGQGAKDDPNSNIPAVDDRADYDPNKIPSNLATVAAPGQIALYVEMLGGQNRLLATSASFKYDPWAPNIFEDLNSDRVMGLWENEGTNPMSDAQFRQLLQANPEGVFYFRLQSALNTVFNMIGSLVPLDCPEKSQTEFKRNAHSSCGNEISVNGNEIIFKLRALKFLFKARESGRSSAVKKSHMSEDRRSGTDSAYYSSPFRTYLHSVFHFRTCFKIKRSGHTAGKDNSLHIRHTAKLGGGNISSYGYTV